jgi:hypothetical protein
MKNGFYSLQEKRFVNIILLVAGVCCFFLLCYLLMKKVGKIHDLEFICLVLSGIVGLVVFFLFRINGLEKPFSIFFSAALIIAMFVFCINYTSLHHNLNLKNTVKTRGIIVSVEKTRQYRVYGYTVKYYLNGKERYTRTQSILLPNQVRDSADVYYSPVYSEYHYATLIPLQ